MSATPTAWQRLMRHPTAIICLVVLAVIVLAAILGPSYTGYGYAQTTDQQFASPSFEHWCGTDLHGRDLLTRILFGARVSLMVGLIGTLVSLIVGVAYGMIAGYRGGRVDALMMRFVDVLYCLPRLIYIIVLITSLSRFTKNSPEARLVLLFTGLGIMEWLTMARIVRGQVLTLKEQQFVLAARTLGASAPRILIRHLLPNLLGVIIVYLTLTIPTVILGESFLSFLGLGIQAPQSSWGSLISDGAAAINSVRIYWWLIVFPGLAMGATLLSLNLLGDHLRDIFDPRTTKA